MDSMKRILGATVCGLSLLASAVHAEQRELRVYNWADYILPSVPKDFAKDTGIKVTWDTFDTNEALEAKLLTGNSGYDVVVPSNVFLAKPRSRPACSSHWTQQAAELEPPRSRLMKLIESQRPGQQVRRALHVRHHADRLQPGQGQGRAGRQCAGGQLGPGVQGREHQQAQGSAASPCSTRRRRSCRWPCNTSAWTPTARSRRDYEKAEALMMKIRPYVTYFHSSKYMADIANGDICVAVGYSGSFSQFGNRAKEASNGVVVDLRLPKEGAPIWFDMLRHPERREERRRGLQIHQLPAATRKSSRRSATSSVTRMRTRTRWR